MDDMDKTGAGRGMVARACRRSAHPDFIPEDEMRRLSWSLVLVIGPAFIAGGCSRAFVSTDPPLARLSVNGRQVGVGKATIPTKPGRVVIVRADHEGFRPTCAILEHRRDTTITLTRAVPNDLPLPPDAEIERTWMRAARTFAPNAPSSRRSPT